MPLQHDTSFETFMRDIRDRLEYVSFEQAVKDAFEFYYLKLDENRVVSQKID